jgi:hypothetical protein
VILILNRDAITDIGEAVMPATMKIAPSFAVFLLGCCAADHAVAQTTRTAPSASATLSRVPSANSTSPNAPCYSSLNPTSPCYSGTTSPSYSATAPSEHPNSLTTPYSSLVAPSPSPDTKNRSSSTRIFTADQAKTAIEAGGYSNVSNLQRSSDGTWRGRAAKDGTTIDVTIDNQGKVVSR